MINYLRKTDKEVARIAYILAALDWDTETVQPAKAAGTRAEEMAMLSSLLYEKETSAEVGEALGKVDLSLLSDADKAIVRERGRAYDEGSKLPPELPGEISLAQGESVAAWKAAREAKDFSILAPALEKLLGLLMKKAEYLSPDKPPYDTYLDYYEPGFSADAADKLFAPLEEDLKRLRDKYDVSGVDDSFLFKPYDKERLHAFCLKVSKAMGFDLSRGAVGITEHPFTTTLGPDDVRISSRYSDAGLFDPIATLIHESGHALYEQRAGANPEIRGTTLSNGASMGFHESQSRLWENLVGRSREFWEHWYPELRKAVPHLEGVSLDEFLRAVNKPSGSLIRVNADELTYNLHIILRHKMEKELFSGTLAVKDVPGRWNDLSEDLLGFRPADDKEGALQDVHWPCGQFGYFPTYSLGNMYAAQIYQRMSEDVDIPGALRSGDYGKLTGWLGDKIWQYGRIYLPSELIVRVTGKGLDARIFTAYLEKRYDGLYGR